MKTKRGLKCTNRFSSVFLRTDHEVRHAAEGHGGDGPQRDDVRQDLGQEVHGHPVVPADVLVADGAKTHGALTSGGEENQLASEVCVCVCLRDIVGTPPIWGQS